MPQVGKGLYVSPLREEHTKNMQSRAFRLSTATGIYRDLLRDRMTVVPLSTLGKPGANGEMTEQLLADAALRLADVFVKQFEASEGNDARGETAEEGAHFERD